jgi:hypothetical protein
MKKIIAYILDFLNWLYPRTGIKQKNSIAKGCLQLGLFLPVCVIGIFVCIWEDLPEYEARILLFINKFKKR